MQVSMESLISYSLHHLTLVNGNIYKSQPPLLTCHVKSGIYMVCLKPSLKLHSSIYGNA